MRTVLRHPLSWLVLLACPLLLVLSSGSGEEAAGVTALPAPTEHRLEQDAEERSNEGRQRWLEEMHVAPPGVDWRAIERANQDRERERRNRLVRLRGDTQTAEQNHWEEVGSKNQAGHMRCATIGPAHGGRRWLYAGSAHGGLWSSDLAGEDWRPISDNLYGGIDEVVALLADPVWQPDVLIVRKGNELYRSADGGATWDVPGGVPLNAVHQLALLPDAQQTVLVLGQRIGTGLVLMASTNRGASFTQRWHLSPNWKGRLWFPRTGAGAGSTVYLVYKGAIKKSIDAGLSFTDVGTIDASATEGLLSGSEAGAPTLYTALKVGGAWKLYRSDDAGLSSQHVHDFGDFWGQFSAFSSLSTAVIYGGTECWRSLDGGVSFQKINPWGAYYSDPANKLHADIRGIQVLPDPRVGFAADVAYLSTDGGTYESTDHGLHVHNLSLDSLGVGQFYSTLTSTNDADLIAAGTQDQGYQRGIRQPYTGSGPSTPFTQLISGDYGHLTSSDGSHALVYSTYPGFVLIQDGETNPILRNASFPPPPYLWLPPVVADPEDATRFFFLGRYLYRYTRTTSSTWEWAQYSQQDFAAFGGNYLSALAFAPSAPQRVYATTDSGKLAHSSDHALTWTLATDPGPGSHYFYGNTIAVHPHDPNEAVVGGSGYGGAGVRRTMDGGQSWQLLVDGLPDTMVYGLCYAPDDSGDLYAATEIGAFHWVRQSGAWENIMDVYAPNTTYWCIEAVDATDVVRFGTYGRGIWDYLVDVPTAGTWRRYGESLGGSNILDLDSSDVPNIGTQQTLRVSGANPLLPGWVMVAPHRASFPFAGGTLLVLPEPVARGISVRLTFVTDSAGNAQTSFTIPSDPILIGTTLAHQALVHDAFMPMGLALSNGLEMRIGY